MPQSCDSSSTLYTNNFTSELLTELPPSSLRYLGSVDSPVRTQLKKMTDKDRDLLHQLHLLQSPRAQSRLVDHILSARKQRELQLEEEEELAIGEVSDNPVALMRDDVFRVA